MTGRKILSTQLAALCLVLLLKVSLPFLLSSCGLKDKIGLTPEKNDNAEKYENIKIDSLRYYFPVSLTDKSNYTTSCDTPRLSTYSGTLLKAKEPVIYSFNNEHDVYRLLEFRANDTCRIISIHNVNGKIWADIKELSRPAYLKAQTSGKFVPVLNYNGSIDTSREVSYSEYESIVGTMGEIKVTSKLNIRLSKVIWDNLEYQVRETDYWNMPSYLNTNDKGEGNWILEARINKKYWLVERWNASGQFRKCCDYLLEIKSLSEKNSSDNWDD